MIKGIDLNHWRNVHNWSAIKSDGVEFCYLKATQGTTYIDPTVGVYFNGSKSVNIPVGLYHYADLGDPVQEALHFKSVLEQYPTYDLLPVLDLEERRAGFDYNTWARAFINALGCEAMLYTGDGFIDEFDLSSLSGLKLWVAKYSSNSPCKYKKVWSNYTIWQYTESGQCAGVNEPVDMNICDSIDAFRVNKVILESGEEKMPKLPYDDNQFRYLLSLAKGQDAGAANWAMNELSQICANVTGATTIQGNGKAIDAVLVDNHTFIRLSDVLDLLGIKYRWDEVQHCVVLE